MNNSFHSDHINRQGTIQRLIELQIKQRGDSPAIVRTDGQFLSYAALQQQISTVRDVLNSGGIGRGDRVAVVLPNGPEMAVAFLGVTACATCAPLNPAYRKDEFEFYLKDLHAKALLTIKNDPTHSSAVARELGIRIIEIEPSAGTPGLFSISMDRDKRAILCGDSLPDDIALILHTSGTTSRPKIVPLTQYNLCVSAHNVAATLNLNERDRCLNVMPLFHIHGLVAALLSTIGSGGSVVCTPGFSEADFFEWMDNLKPTWYTAVPTMHQAILSQTENKREVIKKNPLRFIRSSSSALPPQVMEQLEKYFSSPVIEAYGMTEAAHQMTSNPLPPLTRKPRSVGMPEGPEVAIMGQNGALLRSGETGEIVIRGANVTKGYENNPQANQDAFSNGWFRTGDHGKLDDDGYLFITGRIKEVINRGGEKVSPREVDETLMDHPAVRQAVAFAVPHPSLGEDLAAAVVLREGYNTNETKLRKFVAHRLANFKVPTQIIMVNEIPKGPTGKLQRIGLAERLKDKLEILYEEPDSEIEQLVADIFIKVIGCGRAGRNDNFFALGGDSLGATRAHLRFAETFGIDVPPTMLFSWPTVSSIAKNLERMIEGQNIDYILNQLENLSDEEVQQILEKEDSTGD